MQPASETEYARLRTVGAERAARAGAGAGVGGREREGVLVGERTASEMKATRAALSDLVSFQVWAACQHDDRIMPTNTNGYRMVAV